MLFNAKSAVIDDIVHTTVGSRYAGFHIITQDITAYAFIQNIYSQIKLHEALKPIETYHISIYPDAKHLNLERYNISIHHVYESNEEETCGKCVRQLTTSVNLKGCSYPNDTLQLELYRSLKKFSNPDDAKIITRTVCALKDPYQGESINDKIGQ